MSKKRSSRIARRDSRKPGAYSRITGKVDRYTPQDFPSWREQAGGRSSMARILIIEDDAQLRRLLLQLLVKAGYEAGEASSGSEGLREAETRLPHVLITDILMPDGEGLETIREFRLRYPEVLIIAISGGGFLGELDFLDVAERFGAHRTLAKPFGMQGLLNLVRELLEGQGSGEM